ncbi:hypothetical protein AA0522_2202 [Gluconacetobacter liquefaciens NRIC 0522]|nr:hypothetical protein AA0522_2202 [Gluconacetobacter liquefaciens NRIC 0522]
MHFQRPRLPDFLEQMTLYNLEVGGDKVTVRLVRVDEEVAINVVRRTQSIQVQITN